MPSHTDKVIELTLQVHAPDESTHVDRFTQHCHHPDHDEDEVAP